MPRRQMRRLYPSNASARPECSPPPFVRRCCDALPHGAPHRHRVTPAGRPATRQRPPTPDRPDARQRRYPPTQLANGEVDALVLAIAGLSRLGLLGTVAMHLEPALL